MAKIKIEKPNAAKTKNVKKDIIKKKIPKRKTEDKHLKLILKEKTVPIKSSGEFKLNENLVNLAIEGLFKLTKETVSKKLFENDYPILLQVSLIKIPSCADRVIRLPLKKPLLTETTEVCLVVPDLKRGRNVDYQQTIDYYEDLLRENKVNNVKHIIPMTMVKTEYDQYELKRRLVSLYDYFLADGRICGHLSNLLGKTFYNKRRLPTPVNLENNKIKESIDKALLKTQMHIHAKGNTYSTQIGHAQMSVEDITSNVFSVAEAIGKMIPGGRANIRALHLKTHLSVAIPIYMTLKSVNGVSTPKVTSKRPKLCVDVEGKLSTLLDADVKVTPAGDVIIPKFAKENVE